MICMQNMCKHHKMPFSGCMLYKLRSDRGQLKCINNLPVARGPKIACLWPKMLILALAEIITRCFSDASMLYIYRDAVAEEGAPAMGAKGLCIPFKQPADIKETDKCICPECTKKPIFYTLFGRSY